MNRANLGIVINDIESHLAYMTKLLERLVKAVEKKGDLHFFTGKKHKFDDFEDIISLVRKVYPEATVEGSIGAYSFHQDGVLVVEAWIARKGWWLRIKE